MYSRCYRAIPGFDNLERFVSISNSFCTLLCTKRRIRYTSIEVTRVPSIIIKSVPLTAIKSERTFREGIRRRTHGEELCTAARAVFEALFAMHEVKRYRGVTEHRVYSLK